MIERIKMGIVFDPTLLLNVKSLYKEEYRLGLKVTELLRQKLKIDIDDGEAALSPCTSSTPSWIPRRNRWPIPP